MRKFIGLALAGAAMALATPAAAADNLTCVGEVLGNDFALSQADRISSALIAGNSEIPKLPDAPLDAAAKACAARNAWSGDARDMARRLTAVAILKGAIEKVLRADGQSLDQLRAIYAALPDDTRRAFLDPSKMQDASILVAQRLLAAKVDLNGKHGEHIGMYYGALAAVEFITPLFAAA